MAGFHILVYGTTADDYVVTDSAYFPVQAINRHKIEFKLTQIKDHMMDTVECLGTVPRVVQLRVTSRVLAPLRGGPAVTSNTAQPLASTQAQGACWIFRYLDDY